MPWSSLSTSARATFTPSEPAPTTTAERRASGREPWKRTTRLPIHTASHCSPGVATSQASSASSSK